MRSMTGFGQAAGENDRYRIAVTLRSLNHRYLDLSLRLPEAHRDKEAGLRELLCEGVARGRVEARVEIEGIGAGDVRVTLDRAVVEGLHRAVSELAEAGLLEPGIGLREVAGLPQALRVESLPAAWREADQALLERLTRQALEELTEARTREGGRLAVSIQERLEGLGEVVGELGEKRQAVREGLHSRLRERLRELLGQMDLPEERLVQEAAVLAERSDVQEELDRIGAHLERFQEHLAEPGALGKKLDFLIQEIFRELNTLAAKCRDTEMIGRALDAKTLCDQMREQVQNVE